MGCVTTAISAKELPHIRQRAGGWAYPEIYHRLHRGIAVRVESMDRRDIRRRIDAVWRWCRKRGLVVERHSWREQRQADPALAPVTVYCCAWVPQVVSDEADRLPLDSLPLEKAAEAPQEARQIADGAMPEIPDPEPTAPRQGKCMSIQEWARRRRPKDPPDLFAPNQT